MCRSIREKVSDLRAHLLGLVDPPESGFNQLKNALIMTGLEFFGVLVGLGATGLLSDPKTGLTAAAISAGFTFFTSMATQRGLRKESHE